MSSPLNDALGNAWRVVIDKALKKEKQMDIKPRPTLYQIVANAYAHIAYGWSRRPGSIGGKTEWWDEDIAAYNRAYDEAKAKKEAEGLGVEFADASIPIIRWAPISEAPNEEMLLVGKWVDDVWCTVMAQRIFEPEEPGFRAGWIWSTDGDDDCNPAISDMGPTHFLMNTPNPPDKNE